MAALSAVSPLSWPLSASAAAALTTADVLAMTRPQVASLTASALNAMSPAAFAALSATQVSSLTVAALAGLSQTQAAHLTMAQIKALTASETAALSTGDIASLSSSQVAALNAGALSSAQVAALSSGQTQALTAQQLNALAKPSLAALDAASLTASQVAGLSATAFANLRAAQIASLSSVSVAALTKTEAASLTGEDVAAMSSAQIRSLSTVAISGLAASSLRALSVSQVAALTASQTKGLSGAQLNALAAPAFQAISASALTTAQVAALATSSAAALTSAQAASLSTAAVSALTAAQAKALSTAAVAAFSSAQAAAFSNATLNALGSSQIQALKLSNLSTATIKGLTASAVAALSAAQFAAALGSNIAALSAAAAKGVTVADLDGLTSEQLSAFTAGQRAGMTAEAVTELGRLTAGVTVMSDFKTQTKNGSIDYNGLLKVLQDAAKDGVNKGEFDALKGIASLLNASGGVKTSAYVQQMFDNVVLGNSANATWTGGAAIWQGASVADRKAAPTVLGDMSANSSQTQAERLIGKWFLGTDLPDFSYEAPPQDAAARQGAYRTINAPLFAAGGPSLNDINQGAVGDCFFMAALATEVLQNPDLIRNMISDNGNGTFSVLFHVNGKDDYITVNNQLVVNTSKQYMNLDNSKLMFASGKNDSSIWAGLIEKAYVQLMSQTEATTLSGHGHLNSFAAIEGGNENALRNISGQSIVHLSVNSRTSASTAQSELAALQAALRSGQAVEFGTDNGQNTKDYDLIPSHMFAVRAVDPAKQTVTLFNPWGTSLDAFDGKSTMTVGIAELEKQGGDFWYTAGAIAKA